MDTKIQNKIYAKNKLVYHVIVHNVLISRILNNSPTSYWGLILCLTRIIAMIYYKARFSHSFYLKIYKNSL